MDSCSECGYVYETPREAIPDRLRSLGPRYRDLLTTHTKDHLRVQTRSGVWSPLEYGCHIRDVLRIQRERVELALHEDEPTFASMRREERVIEEQYNEQSPGRVAEEISEAAGALAETLEKLGDDGWLRTGVYNWPDRRPRTIEWIGNHTIHEGEHHLMDMDRLLAQADS